MAGDDERTEPGSAGGESLDQRIAAAREAVEAQMRSLGANLEREQAESSRRIVERFAGDGAVRQRPLGGRDNRRGNALGKSLRSRPVNNGAEHTQEVVRRASCAGRQETNDGPRVDDPRAGGSHVRYGSYCVALPTSASGRALSPQVVSPHIRNRTPSLSS